MSGNSEEGKDSHKTLPLDLARTQITTVRTVDGKAPLLMTSQQLRGMRVLAQGAPVNSCQSSSNAPTIITTNIVPHTAVFKPGSHIKYVICFYLTSFRRCKDPNCEYFDDESGTIQCGKHYDSKADSNHPFDDPSSAPECPMWDHLSRPERTCSRCEFSSPEEQCGVG